ncbi:hypothetical protein MBLNU230_g2964t1 [Neophaeotheca triangularis]
MRLTTVTTALGLLATASAHGEHGGEPNNAHDIQLPPDADWAHRHMAEEHHMADFDAGSFFTLHDYDNSGFWTRDDILTTYGLKDESTKHLSKQQKDDAVAKVLELYDRDRDGTVSFAEYTVNEASGVKLPDFGFGPGHHGDDEYEYEIHHFEKYHGEDTTEEDLVHPEDIEHFRKHEQMEQAALRQESMDRMAIVEANIPMKFRKQG